MRYDKETEMSKNGDFLYVLQCELEEKLTGEQILYQLNLYENICQNRWRKARRKHRFCRNLEIRPLWHRRLWKHMRIKEKQEAAQRGNALKDPFPLTAEEMNAQIKNPEWGFHLQFEENKGWDIRLGKLKLNSWYGTLIILGVVLVIFILLSYLKSHM